jgi:hypothetical protein
MTNPFPVLRLKTDSPKLTEQLGSKPKFWFLLQGDTQPWLFKYTREGTGEDWSERIASEVALLLELPAARVELADFMGKRGSASRSFVRRHEGFDLVHGDELLAGHVIGYDRDKVFRHSSHSVSNIVQAISAVFPEPGARETQLTRFAGLMVLDALIGNTDRHHQNWGVLRRTSEGGAIEHEIAPSFDHASSLGRNEPAANMKRRLQDGTVRNYARKGRGGIFWLSSDAKGANPLHLAEQAAQSWPGYFRPWLMRLQALGEADFKNIIERVPADWMDDLQKEFCLTFLTATCTELKKLPP